MKQEEHTKNEQKEIIMKAKREMYIMSNTFHSYLS